MPRVKESPMRAHAVLRKALTCLFVVMVVISSPISAWAKATKLAVVPIADRAHPIFGVAVQNLVEKPLRQELSVVPPAMVKNAIKHAHLTSAALHQPKRLVALGRALGATHVATIDVSGRGKTTLSHLVIVDVATGHTILSERFALPKAVLNGQIAKHLVTAIEKKLAPGDGEAADTALPDKAEATDDAAAELPAKKATGGFAFPGEGDKDSAPSAEGGDKAELAGDGKDKKDKSDASEAQAAAEDQTDGALRRNSRLAVGLTFMQRTGHLNANPNNNYTTPCYCGTNNNANPLFPAFRLEGEIFPAGLATDSNAWYTNLGLGLAFGVAPVKSYTSQDPNSNVTNPNATIASTVVDLRLAGIYRLKWWDAALAPDNFIQIGFNYFAFPLPKAAFPGVAYSSPFVGLDFHIPVVENLMLLIDASYMFALSPGSDAGTLLGTKQSGQAFSVGGGLRTGWNRYQLNLSAHYERYMVSYKGSTSLNNTPLINGLVGDQWGDVKLSDALLKIMLTCGVVF